jgi:phospholipase/carboxylesterase
MVVDKPVLVMLHGLGGSGTDFDWVGDKLRAWVEPVGLQGPLRTGDRWSWFDLTAGPHSLASRAAEDLLVRIDAEFGARPLALFGFSQGATMVLNLLRLRPTSFRFAIALSGFLAPTRDPRDVAVARARPHVFSGHGARDDVIPIHEAAALRQWLDDNTAHVHRRYATLGHWLNEEELGDLAAFVGGRTRCARWTSRSTDA